MNYEYFKAYIEEIVDILINGVRSPAALGESAPNYVSFYVSKEESQNAEWVLEAILKDFFSEDGKKLFQQAYDNICKRVADIKYFNPKDIPSDEMGYVVHTLMVGLWAELNSSSFNEGIQKVARIGLDADTYGSVAGAILGIKYGYSNIPERYIEPLLIKGKVNKHLEKLFG